MSRRDWIIGNRWIAVSAGLMLVLGIAATTGRIVVQYQTPGPFNHDAQGLCDFHNGIYFPTRAVLAGESPYSAEYAAKYPVARQIPFFSPVILLLHAPLAVLPLHLAEVLNWILQLAMMACLAVLTADAAGLAKRVDGILVCAALMVSSRAGHITLFNGYFTFQLVLLTWLAIHWAIDRPTRSAWCLFIVSAKPTYILPLGLLMLARGNVRALVYGAIISIAGAALTLGWVAYHEGSGDLGNGVVLLKDQIINTQAVHRSMEDESPVFSWTRLDLFAIIAKWRGEDPGDLPHLLSMLGLLILPMAVIARWRLAGREDGLGGMMGALILTAMLVSLYHQSYDSMILAPPIAAILIARRTTWRNQSMWVRWILAGLLAFPAMNYLSTRMFLLRFGVAEQWVRVFTSLNGIALAIGLVMLCWIGWSTARAMQARSDDRHGEMDRARSAEQPA
ncbi:MAG: hypothetical protein AAGJ40_11350 [Planctomycetota bacterium]